MNKKDWLPLSLSIIAIVLSSTALFLVVIPHLPTIEGKPSFNVVYCDVYADYTKICLSNNGTATAHSVRLHIIFAWGGPEITEFISEIPTYGEIFIRLPIGRERFKQEAAPIHTVFVHIQCRELGGARKSFEFPQTLD